jgi:hypothetical protein
MPKFKKNGSITLRKSGNDYRNKITQKYFVRVRNLPIAGIIVQEHAKE